MPEIEGDGRTVRTNREEVGGSWTKLVDAVGDGRGGYAFEGRFLDRGQVDLPLGAVVVCGGDVGSRRGPEKRLWLRLVTEGGDGAVIVKLATDKEGNLDFRDLVARYVAAKPVERCRMARDGMKEPEPERLAMLEATLWEDEKRRRLAREAREAREAAMVTWGKEHPRPLFATREHEEWTEKQRRAREQAAAAWPEPPPYDWPNGTTLDSTKREVEKLGRRQVVHDALDATVRKLEDEIIRDFEEEMTRTVIVSRHAATIAFIRESGLAPEGAPYWRTRPRKTSPGSHVIGNVPLELAAAADRVTTIPLPRARQDETGRTVELSLDDIRRTAGEPATYQVERIPGGGKR